MSKIMSLSSIDSSLKGVDRLRGLLALTAAHVMLRLFSLITIVKFIRLARRSYFRKMSREEADTAWTAIHQSSSFYLGRSACLEFSLAFVLFALSKGQSVLWCTGVKLKPFEAHAWVEIDGKPFREPDYVEHDLKKTLEI
ncbi:lasso peptide biosynthesis B2 protein [Tychonema sp. LEGE 07199]|uniref:lasso peptide biosynthesis B2 protein n=1 Tax=unclassified Tychonema TaxID=2642144 RepID=UPI00188166ED|nr:MULTISPECIES: lasso peptide biosynthesis B2 protein [unclassified Tychonema]MBE9120194.1 lasso peptide biosynthesis B2 protein [Tychonema sp. LEGE 07199]MBE9133038.1 lasso peptide biosynthesis B2 protein [Tychonema sp. LEGE 07196]